MVKKAALTPGKSSGFTRECRRPAKRQQRSPLQMRVSREQTTGSSAVSRISMMIWKTRAIKGTSRCRDNADRVESSILVKLKILAARGCQNCDPKVTAAVKAGCEDRASANRNPRGGGSYPGANPSTTCDQRVKRLCGVEEDYGERHRREPQRDAIQLRRCDDENRAGNMTKARQSGRSWPAGSARVRVRGWLRQWPVSGR